MWGKSWKSLGKLTCSESDGLPTNIQTAGTKVTEVELPEIPVSFGTCVDHGKLCKCEQSDCSLTIVKEFPDVEHAVQANSSFTHTVINMMAMLIGLGQLSAPYAVENGGWVSAFLLIGLAVTCTYTAHLLGKCLNNYPKLKSYTDIGQQAFGTKGKVLVAAFIYMEIFMDLMSYTISLHDNLNIALAGTTIKLPLVHLSKANMLTAVAILVAIPSLWLRDLSSISFLSIGGILTTVIIFVTVASTAIFGSVRADHHIPVLNIEKIPHVSGIYMFCYAGHMVFPDICKAMKDPSKFTKAAIVSFTSVTSLYTALAIMGVKLFGAGIQSQITLSMHPGLVITKIALWATVLAPMTKYALEFTPIAVQLEHNLPPSMKPRARMIIRGSIGSILLLVILTFALTVPYFQYVLNLTGSLVSVTLCVILPCILYTKIFQGNITKPRLILNITIIMLGSFLSIIGTTSSAKSLIQILKGHST